MSGFDNLFDAAISRADKTIRTVMGVTVKVTSGALSGAEFTGVFDDPSEVGYPGAGIRVEGTSPSVFVQTSLVSLLRRPESARTIADPVISGWAPDIPPPETAADRRFYGY